MLLFKKLIETETEKGDYARSPWGHDLSIAYGNLPKRAFLFPAVPADNAHTKPVPAAAAVPLLLPAASIRHPIFPIYSPMTYFTYIPLKLFLNFLKATGGF